MRKLFFCSSLVLVSIVGCSVLQKRTIANDSESTSYEKAPVSRDVQFVATVDTNDSIDFKFDRKLKLSEICKIVYGKDNYNKEGDTPIDVTVYPPQGLSSLIPREDPWAFSLNFDSNPIAQRKYEPKPLVFGEANIGKTEDGHVVEWVGIQPGLALRKTMSINVTNHYISGISYEIRKGDNGQTFEEMTYLGRVNCTLVGF